MTKVIQLKYEILRRLICDLHDDNPYTKEHIKEIAFELEGKSLGELREKYEKYVFISKLPVGAFQALKRDFSKRDYTKEGTPKIFSKTRKAKMSKIGGARFYYKEAT